MTPSARETRWPPGDHHARSHRLRLEMALTVQDGRYVGDMASPRSFGWATIPSAVLADLDSPLAEGDHISL